MMKKSWTLISGSVTTELLLHESVRSIVLVELEITDAGMTVNYYEWCSHSSCENRALLFQSFRESTLLIDDAVKLIGTLPEK